MYHQCSESAFGSGSVRSVCFWAYRISIGSISQRYGSEDPGPHPDPYQNVTDPQNWLLFLANSKQVATVIWGNTVLGV